MELCRLKSQTVHGDRVMELCKLKSQTVHVRIMELCRLKSQTLHGDRVMELCRLKSQTVHGDRVMELCKLKSQTVHVRMIELFRLKFQTVHDRIMELCRLRSHTVHDRIMELCRLRSHTVHDRIMELCYLCDVDSSCELKSDRDLCKDRKKCQIYRTSESFHGFIDSDGLEYDIYSKKELKNKKTAEYSPWSNGVVERHNSTPTETINKMRERALTFHGRLPYGGTYVCVHESRIKRDIEVERKQKIMHKHTAMSTPVRKSQAVTYNNKTESDHDLVYYESDDEEHHHNDTDNDESQENGEESADESVADSTDRDDSHAGSQNNSLNSEDSPESDDRDSLDLENQAENDIHEESMEPNAESQANDCMKLKKVQMVNFKIPVENDTREAIILGRAGKATTDKKSWYNKDSISQKILEMVEVKVVMLSLFGTDGGSQGVVFIWKLWWKSLCCGTDGGSQGGYVVFIWNRWWKSRWLCCLYLEQMVEVKVVMLSLFGTDGGSQGGYVVFLMGYDGNVNPITWQSKKLRRVVRSTLASEALALADGVDCVISLAALFKELMHNGNELKHTPVNCFVDNKDLYHAIYSDKPVGEKRLRV
ncbi:unnamed protein product [Mytilus coruscus]|uniref:Integrase catalytic domain-containing protein n=1 Tax=Mytilus coruscus TaxID=42192 RepID=A0A6J8DEG6_MYTCO|nr:unnamed protein product [Mytilus coruscus]